MSELAMSQPDSNPRLFPLGAIILLHVAGLYALLNGMQKPEMPPTVPREIIAMLITPQAAPTPVQQPVPPTPQPVPKVVEKPVPKVVEKPTPVVKKPSPPKPAPVPRPEPTEKSISTPAPPPAVAAAPAAPEPQAAPAQVAPAAPPAPPAAPAPPKTVSGVEYIQPPQPDYPPIAKRMGEEGKVMLRVLVSDRGRPEKVDVQKSSGFARLDEAARQAAMRAMFKPHLEDGKPVAVYALIPINFSIQ
jgi:protein TonB